MTFSDPEWEEAEKADEESHYYYVEKISYGRPSSVWYGDYIPARYIKLYKPSIAKLVAKRTGWKIERRRVNDNL